MPEASVAPAWAIPGYLEAREGRLFVEGVDSAALAGEYDTPLFVFSGPRVRSNVSRLVRAAERVAHPVRFFYASKANSTMGLLKVVREAGISAGDGWRLFTPGEREWGPWTTLLTAGWMAALLWPLGYLASARSRAAVVVAALSAGVTLLLLPIVSGCAWLPLGGWCGAASGLLVGSHTRAPFKRGSGSD